MNGKKALWILPILLWSAAGGADPSQKDRCGTGSNATLEERLKDCTGGLMRLVMSDDAGREIKLDDWGVLWGPKLEGRYSFPTAQEDCKTVTAAQGYPRIPGVGEWRAPKAEEWARIGRKNQRDFNGKRSGIDRLQKDIQGNGSWKELADMDAWYWSSESDGPGVVWSFNGDFDEDGDGVVDRANQDWLNFFAVRCVASR